MNLNRDQILKGILLQIGDLNNIPKDILIYIYQLVKDDSEIRDYYTNIIYKETLLIDTTDDDFKTKIPINRGIEWSIKWNKNRVRRHLHLKIKILGEAYYLFQDSLPDDGQIHYAIFGHLLQKASKEIKFKYLNLSPIEEIIEDYNEFITNDKYCFTSLILDNFGEARYI